MDPGIEARLALLILSATLVGHNHRVCCALDMRELKRGRVLQAVPKHPVQADVADPDQAHFPEQGAGKENADYAQESREYIAVDQVVDDAGHSIWPPSIRQQTQVRKKEQTREHHPVMRKQQVVCTTGGGQEAQSLGAQEVDGAGQGRLTLHDLHCKPWSLNCQDLRC